jgi:hypothetical protein
VLESNAGNEHRTALSLMTAPVIYSLIVPLFLLDLWVSLYQLLCFPAYGLPWIRRAAYFVIDRHKLAYLNAVEKLNCTFCSYGNGVIAYVGAVAAATEAYWCPIKHARAVPVPHERYASFFLYGDARAYRRNLAPLRQTLREEARGCRQPARAGARRAS